jgi:hypothetical protein
MMAPRRIVQAISLLGLVFIIWMTRYPLKGFVNPLVYFYADPLAMFTTALAERVLLFGLIVSGSMLALTFVLGRFFCGWLCPLGAVIDIGGWLAKGTGLKKKGKAPGAGFPGEILYPCRYSPGRRSRRPARLVFSIPSRSLSGPSRSAYTPSSTARLTPRSWGCCKTGPSSLSRRTTG